MGRPDAAGGKGLIAEHEIEIVRQRDRAVHFTEYLVNAPPAWVIEFGPSAA